MTSSNRGANYFRLSLSPPGRQLFPNFLPDRVADFSEAASVSNRPPTWLPLSCSSYKRKTFRRDAYVRVTQDFPTRGAVVSAGLNPNYVEVAFGFVLIDLYPHHSVTTCRWRLPQGTPSPLRSTLARFGFDVDHAVAGVDRLNQTSKCCRPLRCPGDERDVRPVRRAHARYGVLVVPVGNRRRSPRSLAPLLPGARSAVLTFFPLL